MQIKSDFASRNFDEGHRAVLHVLVRIFDSSDTTISQESSARSLEQRYSQERVLVVLCHLDDRLRGKSVYIANRIIMQQEISAIWTNS